MNSQWYLIDAFGKTEIPVKAPTDMAVVKVYSPRLYSRWVGDPREKPGRDGLQVLNEKIWSGQLDHKLAELDPVLRGDGIGGFRLEQIRLRAGLSEANCSRKHMNKPLVLWAKELLAQIVPVLLELQLIDRYSKPE